MKRHLIRTLSLAAVLALILSAMSAAFLFVGAVDNSSIFNASNAENISGDEGYLTYRLQGEDNEVTFRRNLALKWNAPAEENSLESTTEYFSLTMGFVKTSFESFTIALETSQFTMSKDGKTTNELTFTNDNGTLSVSVNGEEATATVSATDSIVIGFSSDDSYGNFTVALNGEPLKNAKGEGLSFTNIGKYYAQYASSSATTPLTPLTFTATFAEGQENAEFNIQNLNGQDFTLTNGEVTDDVAPVLVVNSDIRQIYFGTAVDFDTVTIDVCSSGSTTDEYYYYPGLETTEDDTTITVGADDNARTYLELGSDTIFYPETFGDSTPQVSIAYRVQQGDNSAVYLIDWSATVNDSGFIDVVDANDVNDKPTMTFRSYQKNGNTITLDPISKEQQDQIDAYQTAVEEASWKKDENGDYVLKEDGAHESIQVGAGAYYYIPAFKQYVEDVSCGYTDMEFTVYYRVEGSSTTVSTVSGSYDELRIELTAEGRYQFRIVPTNSAGNSMVGLFASGSEGADDTSGNLRYREETITSSNVFDAKNLQTFEFRVEYTGPSIEEPADNDDTGYVDVSYSVEDFEIVGVSGSYTTHYRLYYFQPTDTSRAYTAAELRAADADGSNELGTWKMINMYDASLEDDDPDNNNDYSWNPDSSLSFVPQEQGFYKVEVIVVSDNLGVQQEAKYIEVAANADVIPGETYWLENNILSLVFLGVGILCLIGIIVILLIKPKNKGEAAAEESRKAELKDKRKNRN